MNQAAVFEPMLPHAEVGRPLGQVLQYGLQALVLLVAAKIADGHLQELGLAVAVVPDGGLVDGQKLQRFPIVHPHRLGNLGKQRAESMLTGLLMAQQAPHRRGQSHQFGGRAPEARWIGKMELDSSLMAR